MVAGTGSGTGKTTLATGLMAALCARGTAVAPAKVGPDFIDPGYHRLATGRPGRNLDVFLSGEEGLLRLAGRAAAGSDLLLAEGVMGLFDGVGATATGSTADVARLLGAPVLLVVDAASMAASVVALVDGFDRALAAHGVAPPPGRPAGHALAGVLLNRVGSDTHESILREALAGAGGPPVVGCLRRRDDLVWRHRHLGLVPVVEDPAAVRGTLDRLAQVVAASVDLDAVVRIAGAAPPRQVHEPLPAARVARGVGVAVAAGPAFSFCYPETLERLAEAGADLLEVDPLEDRALPAGAAALYAGGGYPEQFVGALSANRPLAADVARRVGGGLVTWAECAGMLWLSQSLDGRPLCGVLPAAAAMGTRVTVGYRTATFRRPSPLAPAGAVLRGHEHHYSATEPAGDALVLEGRAGTALGGWATPRLLASYLHLHVGADPAPVERFVAAAGDGGGTFGA